MPEYVCRLGAPDGAVVKTAGVAEDMTQFTGPAVIFESQEAALTGILAGQVKDGDVVVIRYEGPRGGPGMQEMLAPTTAIRGVGLDEVAAESRDDAAGKGVIQA